MKKFKVEVEVTEEQVRDIIIDGLETGIGYWALLDNNTPEFEKRYAKNNNRATSEIVSDILLDGGSVDITDKEGCEKPKYKLTLDRLLKGIVKNHDERPWDCDLNEADACTTDCIIQYAIFDEIVFG